MSRYFFDIYDGHDLRDSEGTELPDRHAVRGEAIRCAGEILRDIDGALSGKEWSMTVRDRSGRIVMTLCFSAVEHWAPEESA